MFDGTGVESFEVDGENFASTTPKFCSLYRIFKEISQQSAMVLIQEGESFQDNVVNEVFVFEDEEIS